MPVLLDDIAAILQQRGISGVHKGFMPDKPDNIVALFEYAGEPMEMTMGSEDAVLERPGLQVRVRDKSYSAGRARIQAVVDALHGLSNEVLGDRRYLLIQANQSPESLGLDQNMRSEFVCNFSVLKER